jgi:hypothetical protein
MTFEPKLEENLNLKLNQKRKRWAGRGRFGKFVSDLLGPGQVGRLLHWVSQSSIFLVAILDLADRVFDGEF